MTIAELGSIGELIAAIATVATLIYLAVQLRQNTRALRSQTFQQISAQMGRNVENITSDPDLAEIALKGFATGEEFTPVERVRFQGLLVMTFRRLEAVYVQCQLGSISPDMVNGFEQSLLPMLNTPAGKQWWESARRTFHDSFVVHVEERLASGEIAVHSPSMSVPGRADDA